MAKFFKKFFEAVSLAIAMGTLIIFGFLNNSSDWFARFALFAIFSFSIAAATFLAADHPRFIQVPHIGFFFSGVAFGYCALFTVAENELIVHVMTVFGSGFFFLSAIYLVGNMFKHRKSMQ